MQPFDYEKEQYRIVLKSGEVITAWPNAGRWHALDGTGKVYRWADLESAEIMTEENAPIANPFTPGRMDGETGRIVPN